MSETKSIMALLIGIAISKGQTGCVGDKTMDYMSAENMDKKELLCIYDGKEILSSKGIKL